MKEYFIFVNILFYVGFIKIKDFI